MAGLTIKPIQSLQKGKKNMLVPNIFNKLYMALASLIIVLNIFTFYVPVVNAQGSSESTGEVDNQQDQQQDREYDNQDNVEQEGDQEVEITPTEDPINTENTTTEEEVEKESKPTKQQDTSNSQDQTEPNPTTEVTPIQEVTPTQQEQEVDGQDYGTDESKISEDEVDNENLEQQNNNDEQATTEEEVEIEQNNSEESVSEKEEENNDDKESTLETEGVETKEVDIEEEKTKLKVREGKKVTWNSLQANTKYTYDINPKVSITFTKLDESVDNPNISIEEVKVSKDGEEVVGYEIKSNQTNKKFKYNLTLPQIDNSKDVEVEYSEDKGKTFQEVNKEEKVENDTVKIEGLDHFTVFIVVPVDPANPGDSPLPGETISYSVTETNPGPWIYTAEEYVTGSPTTPAQVNFVAGPATPPVGVGSANLQSGEIGTKGVLYSSQFDEIQIDEITDLTYSVYVESSSTNIRAPYVNIYLDTDSNGSIDKRLDYDIGAVATDTWVLLNPWDSAATWNVRDYDTSSNASMTTADIISMYGTAEIISDWTSGFKINVGDSGTPAWSGVNAYVDNVVLNTLSGDDYQIDFEGDAPTALEAPQFIGWNDRDVQDPIDASNVQYVCGDYIAKEDPSLAGTWDAVSGNNVRYIRLNQRPDGTYILIANNGMGGSNTIVNVDAATFSDITTQNLNGLQFISDNMDISYPNPNTGSYGSFGKGEGTYTLWVVAFEDTVNNNKYDVGENISAWSSGCTLNYDYTAPTGLDYYAWDTQQPTTGYTALDPISPDNFVTCGGTLNDLNNDYLGVWTEATDPNGVTYERQFVYVPKYNSSNVQKYNQSPIYQNYTGTFTPQIGDILNGGEGTYYVRVRAIDDAGNATISDAEWADTSDYSTTVGDPSVSYDPSNAPWCDLTIDFDSLRVGSLQGRIYWDRDITNGIFDDAEKNAPGDPNRLNGWNVELYLPFVDNVNPIETLTTSSTGQKGQYRFENLIVGQRYEVCTVSPDASWAQTSPTSGMIYDDYLVSTYAGLIGGGELSVVDRNGKACYSIEIPDNTPSATEIQGLRFGNINIELEDVEQVGYNENNGGGDSPATPRVPNELACSAIPNEVATNINSVSVHWTDENNGSAYADDNLMYQRQFMRPSGADKYVPSGSWEGSEYYTEPYTDFRRFGSIDGREGVYGSRVRVFYDINNSGDYDAGDPVSGWSNECYITFLNTEPEQPVFWVEENSSGNLIEWIDLEDTNLEYNIYYANSADINTALEGDFTLIDTVVSGVGMYVDTARTGLYYVRAIDIAANESAFDAIQSKYARTFDIVIDDNSGRDDFGSDGTVNLVGNQWISYDSVTYDQTNPNSLAVNSSVGGDVFGAPEGYGANGMHTATWTTNSNLTGVYEIYVDFVENTPRGVAEYDVNAYPYTGNPVDMSGPDQKTQNTESRWVSIGQFSFINQQAEITVKIEDGQDSILFDAVALNEISNGATIQGRKYEDLNINGELDEDERNNEYRLNNWEITLYDENWNEVYDDSIYTDTSVFTGSQDLLGNNLAKGQYRFTNLVPGTYYVCETLQDGWQQSYFSTTPVPFNGDLESDNDCNEIEITNNQFNDELVITGVHFGNYQEEAFIEGEKYRDVNQNGIFDADEQVDVNRIDGWTINLYEVTDIDSDTGNVEVAFRESIQTGSTEVGQYRFEDLDTANYYVVCEEYDNNTSDNIEWTQTSPFNATITDPDLLLIDNDDNIDISALLDGVNPNAESGNSCYFVGLRSRGQTDVRFGNYDEEIVPTPTPTDTVSPTPTPTDTVSPTPTDTVIDEEDDVVELAEPSLTEDAEEDTTPDNGTFILPDDNTPITPFNPGVGIIAPPVAQGGGDVLGAEENEEEDEDGDVLGVTSVELTDGYYTIDAQEGEVLGLSYGGICEQFEFLELELANDIENGRIYINEYITQDYENRPYEEVEKIFAICELTLEGFTFDDVESADIRTKYRKVDWLEANGFNQDEIVLFVAEDTDTKLEDFSTIDFIEEKVEEVDGEQVEYVVTETTLAGLPQVFSLAPEPIAQEEPEATQEDQEEADNDEDSGFPWWIILIVLLILILGGAGIYFLTRNNEDTENK